MKQVNLYQAKTHLSALIEEAAAGAKIIIANSGKPRAKLVPLTAEKARPKPNFGFGDHYGWKLPDDFDDPDPEIEAMFFGDDNEPA